MKNRKLLKYLLPALFAVLGAAAGWLYYRFVGCASGACAITSDPINSAFYGGLMGLFLGVLLTPEKRPGEQSDKEKA